MKSAGRPYRLTPPPWSAVGREGRPTDRAIRPSYRSSKCVSSKLQLSLVATPHRIAVRPHCIMETRATMDAELMEALAEILADALTADLETQEEQGPIGTTTESPTASRNSATALEVLAARTAA